MSLPLTEWISGALSRSESARNSSAAPWHPAPHMIDDAAGRIDAAGDFGNVRLARRDLGPRLQSRDARDAAVGLGANDILRQRQVGDAAARIGGGDRLMNDARRLGRRGDGFGIERDVAEQEIRLGGLDVVGAVQLARHVAGQRQHRRVVAARLIEARDQVGAAGAGGAGAHRKPAGELGLAGRGKRGAFFVADADPFDLASPDRVGERIERIADQPEYMLDPDLLAACRPEGPQRYGTSVPPIPRDIRRRMRGPWGI